RSSMRRNTQGLALIYVIVIMSLLSVYLVELMSNSRIMLRQTRRAELAAIDRNLQASGAAWIRHNSSSIPQEGITLDTSLLSKRQASITLVPDAEGIQIETTCTLAAEIHKQTRTAPTPSR
ncbi:MAG: hypothetical protein K9N55_06620, partial [Phycisphaerae bacterium]|nr:hypothetical protein [Phycisphaerae bacterium]